jgi:hypothetical protein
MIVGLFITIFLGLINVLLGFLPSTGYPESISFAIDNFMQSVYQFNGILPIDTLFVVLGYTAYFWLAIGLFWVVRWVIHLLRGN